MITPVFKDTVTIYNRHQYTDAQTGKTKIKWFRTVLHNCYYSTKRIEVLNGNILSQADSYSVRIPENKKYRDTAAWKNMPLDLINKYFTISTGDVIVKGEISDDIEDTAGKRITDLIEKYKPNCFTVKTFSDNTKIKFGAHYAVGGV